jgi:hypothetical protein
MDYNDIIICNPDLPDISSDEEFEIDVTETGNTDCDDKPLYSDYDHFQDVIEISSDEDEQDSPDHRTEEDVVTLTHTIGITMTKNIKLKNGAVIGEERLMDIYFSEGLDPKCVDIGKLTEEALQEIPVFLSELKRQNYTSN